MTTYTLRHDAAEYVIHFVDEGHDSVEVVYATPGRTDEDSTTRVLMMREEAKKVWASAVDEGAKRTA